MEHYVTLFDSLFLPQGIALHASMQRHVGIYTLWILCVDEVTFEVLQRINLPNVRLLRLDRLETGELKRVKLGRTKGEYCWTLTPFAPRFVFEADPSVTRVTYIDADMWFRKSPSAIFRDFDASKKHVLITDHAYAAEHDQSELSGQYCVQFMTFSRDAGEAVRQWWEERCIEWCYSRSEDGKFGDQKYLDDWPERFPDQVHVLTNKELILAPWNASRFPYGGAVAWHFHSLRIYSKHGKKLMANWGRYPIPEPARKYLYSPYIDDLRSAISVLKKNGVTVTPQIRHQTADIVKNWLRSWHGQLWRFNQNLNDEL